LGCQEPAPVPVFDRRRRTGWAKLVEDSLLTPVRLGPGVRTRAEPGSSTGIHSVCMPCRSVRSIYLTRNSGATVGAVYDVAVWLRGTAHGRHVPVDFVEVEVSMMAWRPAGRPPIGLQQACICSSYLQVRRPGSWAVGRLVGTQDVEPGVPARRAFPWPARGTARSADAVRLETGQPAASSTVAFCGQAMWCCDSGCRAGTGKLQASRSGREGGPDPYQISDGRIGRQAAATRCGTGQLVCACCTRPVRGPTSSCLIGLAEPEEVCMHSGPGAMQATFACGGGGICLRRVGRSIWELSVIFSATRHMSRAAPALLPSPLPRCWAERPRRRRGGGFGDRQGAAKARFCRTGGESHDGERTQRYQARARESDAAAPGLGLGHGRPSRDPRGNPPGVPGDGPACGSGRSRLTGGCGRRTGGRRPGERLRRRAAGARHSGERASHASSSARAAVRPVVGRAVSQRGGPPMAGAARVVGLALVDRVLVCGRRRCGGTRGPENASYNRRTGSAAQTARRGRRRLTACQAHTARWTAAEGAFALPRRSGRPDTRMPVPCHG